MILLAFFIELFKALAGYISTFSVVELLSIVSVLSVMAALFIYLVRREYEKEPR